MSDKDEVHILTLSAKQVEAVAHLPPDTPDARYRRYIRADIVRSDKEDAVAQARREMAREIADYADRIVEQGAVLTGRLIRMKWLEDGDG